MIIFEAGKVVHTKWRRDIDAAKLEMGLMHPVSQTAIVPAEVRSRSIFIHDNDNDSGAVFPPVIFSSVQKDMAS